jgi:uncharacterized membrane protein
MSKLVERIILFLFLSLFFISASIGAQPTEQTLISKWENIQKSDAKTKIFEKIDERLYKFKTEQFPFDGELRILNVIIDDRMSDFEYGYIMGIIEVELVDLPEDFLTKYSQSYGLWTQNNTLYFDNKTNEWLSSKEYFAKTAEQAEKYPFWRGSLWSFIDPVLLILIALIVFLLLYSRKVQKANRAYMDTAMDSTKKSLEISQKALAIGEESNKILKEILEVLKKR